MRSTDKIRAWVSVTRSSEIDSAASLEVAGFDQRARGTEKRSPWRSHLALIERPFFDQDRARSCPKLSLFSVHSLSTSPNEPTIHGTLRWKQSRPATLFVLAGQLLIAQSIENAARSFWSETSDLRN
jgi:hypothetical protein